MAVYNFFTGGMEGEGADFLFSLVTSDRKWNELHQEKFRLDIRKSFFIERVVGHQNRLPREVVMAPSLSQFKECLDNTQPYSLVLGSPGRSRELDQVILTVPFQFEIFYDN